MKSIQRYLIIWLLGTTLALAAGCGVLLYLYVQGRLTAEFDRALVAKAQLLMDSVTSDGHRLRFGAPEAELGEFRRSRHPGYFQIWQSDGTVVARSDSLKGNDITAKMPAPMSPIDMTLPDGESGRSVVRRFRPHVDEEENADNHSTTRGRAVEATILLVSDRDDLDDTLGVLASSMLAAAGVLAIGTIVVVTVAVRRGLRPLHRMANEADAVTAASLDHRFSLAELPRELRPIGQRLNELLARLDQAFAREKRFTADVAHELRTPIAELRAMAEVALKWPDKTAAEQNYRDTLNVAGQMESLVTTLLAIARCQAGVAPIEVRPVELAGLLHQVWRSHAATAEQRRLVVAWDGPIESTVMVDRAMLGALLENLISNAVTYTPAGGRIELRISQTAESVQLTISNTCDDLEASDLPHLFEPFWRKDAARTSGLRCGLGLSLVAAYALAMGIEIKADLPASDRFTVTVRLKATSSEPAYSSPAASPASVSNS